MAVTELKQSQQICPECGNQLLIAADDITDDVWFVCRECNLSFAFDNIMCS